jgi:protein O-GlcNAc transferase
MLSVCQAAPNSSSVSVSVPSFPLQLKTNIVKNSALLQSTSPLALEHFSAVVAACHSALARYDSAPEDAAALSELQARRQEVARAVAQLSKWQIEDDVQQRLFELRRALAASAVDSSFCLGTEMALANELKGHGLGGLLGVMLLVPAWRLPAAPDIGDVPPALWGEYAAWLFHVPAKAPADLAHYANLWLERLKSLEHWVQRNPASSAVQAALESYLQAPVNPEYFPLAGDMRRQAELRGQILLRTQAKDRLPYETTLTPRDGRRLRVGFVARHFGPGVDLFTALPCFAHLDSKQHEVFLLALEESDTLEAKHATRCAKLCQVLPAEWPARLELIRSACLDVLVFVGDFAGLTNDIGRLALHRLASLQVMIQRTGITTGLPEMDMYVTGAQAATPEAGARFTERIGLLRGPAHAFDFVRTEFTPALTREELGIEEGVTALASVVTSGSVPHWMLDTWAEILAHAPATRLYLAFVQDEKTAAIEKFCTQIDAALGRRGVDTGRVTIFPSWGGSASDVRSLLIWADLYLDPGDIRSPVWLAAALVAGLPAICLRSPHNPDADAAAGMLREVNAPELISTDLGQYASLATAVAVDGARRSALRERVKGAVAAEPGFLDSLAASDAFGALITTAYDELASLGRAQFRQQQEPLRCFGVDTAAESVESGLAAMARGDLDSAAFDASLALRSDPANHQARHLQGLVLHSQGEHSRAVDYLLAAVQHPDADAAIWLALAKALRDNRQLPQAIEALEACMRLAPRQVEPLLLMLDFAEAVGSTDIAREVLRALQQVAPDDARVLAMS